MIDAYVTKKIHDFLLLHISRENEYVLYPNGAEGKEVERQLREDYCITPVFAIDNFHHDGKTVFSIEEAADRMKKNTKILICSDNAYIYQDLREALYQKIPKANIIDIFHVDLPSDGQILEELNEMDLEVSKYLKA